VTNAEHGCGGGTGGWMEHGMRGRELGSRDCPNSSEEGNQKTGNGPVNGLGELAPTYRGVRGVTSRKVLQF
jgi:hypothetical protein